MRQGIGNDLAEGCARFAEKIGRYKKDVNSGTLSLAYWGTANHYDPAIEAEWGGGAWPLSSLAADEIADLWDVVTYAARFEEEILISIETLEFSHLAKYAFLLCQKLNGYYHKYPVLAEENEEIKSARLRTITLGRRTLIRALDLMGIPVPEKM